jgi:TRAP-type mannitol/chloroaromatic compound transport system permease small subunit
MNNLRNLANLIDAFNEFIGKSVSWLALIMVLVQMCIVVMRYVFGVGSIFLQETIVYMHGTLFMLAAGYTLLHNDHVRVDIFYRTASPKKKALVDLVGVFVFLAPVMILIVVVSWRYIAQSWSIFEGSTETSGIQGVYLLKTVILIFVALFSLQGISLAIHSAAVLMGLETKNIDDPDVIA